MLYNQSPADATVPQVQSRWPNGTKLAVKAPYYKVFRDGTSGIRVDNPADVVVLHKEEGRQSTACQTSFDTLSNQGKEAFR